MSLWISSTRENNRGFPPLQGLSTAPRVGGGRSLFTYVLVGIVGLVIGLIVGQIAAEHRSVDSRIQWPEPVLPHPRTLPP
jgi:hypothetical protein